MVPMDKKCLSKNPTGSSSNKDDQFYLEFVVPYIWRNFETHQFWRQKSQERSV